MNEILESPLFSPGPIIFVQELFGPGAEGVFRAIDLLATTWGVLFVAALALWVWGREDLYAMVAIMGLEVVINMALNQVFHVDRPSSAQVRVYDDVPLGSFPSGHVFTATAAWGLLWVRRRVSLWVTALVVLGVAVSRLFLGAHFLGDVIAGVLLGAALVWGFTAMWPRARAWLGGRPYPFFVVSGVVASAAAVASLLLLEGNHFAWNSAGLTAGASLAILLESRHVRYDPERARPRSPLLRVLAGAAVLVLLIWVDRSTGDDALAIGAAASFAGAIWALLLAPALFSRDASARPTSAAGGHSLHAGAGR